MKKIKYNELLKFTKKVLYKSGLDKFSLNAVTLGLCEASLRGVDSHGVRLLKHYSTSAIKGRKNINPKMKFNKKFPALGVLDANDAFGHAAGFKAIDEGCKIANKYGIAAIIVNNSSHSGSMASMALKGARKGFFVFAFTHADSLMKTYGGKNAFFGTNPICFAAPRKNKEPYCLDMSTTNISWNKLLNYKTLRKKLPHNIAADNKGHSTIFPELAKTLLPIGDYKGFGLASMIEILCGVQSGMKFGIDIPPMYTYPLNKKRKLSQFYIVIRTDGYLTKTKFLDSIDNLYKQLYKSENNKKHKIMMPNDPEINISKKRLKEGIPLDKEVFNSFMFLSKNFNIKFKTF